MEKHIKSSDYLRKMNMVYGIQAISLIAFSLVIFYLNQKISGSDLAATTQYSFSIAIIAGLVASQFVPRILLKKINSSLGLSDRVFKYFPIVIIRAACLEISGFVACIAAFVTGKQYFLLIVPLLLIVFIFYRPTRSLIAEELGLNTQEKNKLENPNTLFTQGGK